jgi:hypothetical protein
MREALRASLMDDLRASLGPAGCARVKARHLAIAGHVPPPYRDEWDDKLDRLLAEDAGHRWFTYCLDAVARESR